LKIIIPQTILYFAIILEKGIEMTLTIIGAGSMAMAMADGLKDRYKLEFVVRDLSKVDNLREKYAIKLLDDFNINSKNIILAVKPYALKSVGSNLKGEANTLYSVLAGTSIEDLKESIKSKSYIRTMPNVSAKFGVSTTIITGDIDKRGEAIEIFSSIGDTFWVETQKEIDIATGVAGSGPALLALVAEAMMDGLVKEGMKRADAISITNSLFKGFSPLISSNHPAVIKDSVMSPAGTTASAYSTLEEGSVRSSFIKAIGEAFKVTQNNSC
jgi:pyrroline-5-carboxylate reductase